VQNILNDVPAQAFDSRYPHVYVKPEYSDADKQVLRELADRNMENATLPCQEVRKRLWSKLNDLERTRPMVWFNEICWHEMDVDRELTTVTSTEFARQVETELRRNIYLWKHMQADMVVQPVLYSPMIIENSGIGIGNLEDTVATDVDNPVVSHRYKPQIVDWEDISKITEPKVFHNIKQTAEVREAYEDIFHGISPVEIRGCPGLWFAPWDDIVQMMGVEKTLENLAENPDFMHALVDKLVNVYLFALDQYESEGLIASNNCNFRIGSGAYGYSDDLPPAANSVAPEDIWGCASPQIFGTVSPGMHDEFGIEYENRWLKRFKLAYYGCCERLDNRIEILRKIENLRKISISPWADEKNAAELIQRDYVISLKPNPSYLAMDSFDPGIIERELRQKLENTKNCNVEVIIKDISTVKYQPQRLWQWIEVASRLVSEY